MNQAITQKDVAVYALRELHVLIPYVLDFEANDTVYLFEGENVRRVAHGSGLDVTIHRLEEHYNVKIYAVTHDYMDFGEMYSFLCVSHYKEDFEHMFRRVGKDIYMAYAYVLNMTHDVCSEFGSVVLETGYCSFRRVG